jgi:MYXO-CTERM domain-containing protein
MVTYQIDGLGGSGDTWLLLFNDFGTNVTNTYFDYQNLVIQVNTEGACSHSSSSVPEPGSLMLVGGIGLGLLRRLPRRVR